MKIEILTDDQKHRFRTLFDPFVNLLVKLKIHPNVLTALSLLFSLVAAVYYASGAIAFAGFWFLLGGLFDMVDGAVARRAQQESVFGAFFDSVLDRFTEIAVFTGILVHFYFHSVFHPVLLGVAIIAILLAVSGSLMVSYARARAEGLGLQCNVGLLQRPERLVMLAIASFISNFILLIAIIAIAVLANYTAVQRIIYIYNSCKKCPPELRE